MRKLSIAALAVLSFAAVPLQAQVSSCINGMGTILGNPFGGSGIPTTNTQTVECAGVGTNDDIVLRMGIRAHQRGTNAEVTYLGSGRFLAAAGPDVSVAPPFNPNYATWNFGFFVSGAAATQLSYRLRYDFNGAVGNSGDLGTFSWSNFALGNSWNLGMGFLSTSGALPGPSNLLAPTGPAFNRNLAGEYSFILEAYDANNAFVGSTSMTVVSAVPEPSTYVLMAAGLAGLLVVQRRRRSA